MNQKITCRILFHPDISYAEAGRIARDQGGRLARSSLGIWSINKHSAPQLARRDFNPVAPCVSR